MLPIIAIGMQNSNVGGYNSRGFVEVLAASQTNLTKSWFQVRWGRCALGQKHQPGRDVPPLALWGGTTAENGGYCSSGEGGAAAASGSMGWSFSEHRQQGVLRLGAE